MNGSGHSSLRNKIAGAKDVTVAQLLKKLPTYYGT
jgi:hypothetical protein